MFLQYILKTESYLLLMWWPSLSILGDSWGVSGLYIIISNVHTEIRCCRVRGIMSLSLMIPIMSHVIGCLHYSGAFCCPIKIQILFKKFFWCGMIRYITCFVSNNLPITEHDPHSLTNQSNNIVFIFARCFACAYIHSNFF